MLVAVLAMFILPDFPETKHIRWLTPAEHALARRRMIEDSTGAACLKPSDGANEETPSSRGALTEGLTMAVTDWKVWFFVLTLLLETISSSFFMYFPTLASTMGYNPTVTLLLCAPPWFISAIWTLWLSWHSDRTGERCMHTIASFAFGIIGSLLAMSTMNTAVRYISL